MSFTTPAKRLGTLHSRVTNRGMYGRLALLLTLTGLGVVAFGVLKAEPTIPGGPTTLATPTVLQAQAPAARPPAPPAPPPAAASTAPATPPPAAARPAPEKPSGAAPAWAVTCVSKARSAAVDCKAEQRLFAKETGRLLAIAMVDVPGATRQAALILHLPTGLALQEGASLTIDGGQATPLPWQSCDASGCYAKTTLTPALIEAMKKGTSMVVKAASASGGPMVFQFVLTDFAASYEAAQ